mmetsp:Transcript_58845/g.162709  ORF Transcript_58845/g.162709 Transcript_58845/m.162709 type:complete len:232 (+) Transcript_58845:114-809(+)
MARSPRAVATPMSGMTTILPKTTIRLGHKGILERSAPLDKVVPRMIMLIGTAAAPTLARPLKNHSMGASSSRSSVSMKISLNPGMADTTIPAKAPSTVGCAACLIAALAVSHTLLKQPGSSGGTGSFARSVLICRRNFTIASGKPTSSGEVKVSRAHMSRPSSTLVGGTSPLARRPSGMVFTSRLSFKMSPPVGVLAGSNGWSANSGGGWLKRYRPTVHWRTGLNSKYTLR